MEVMGGASYMDGDWESICRILSFDQDSHIPNGSENLLGFLMADSNPTTSQSELGFPTSFSFNLPQFNCGFGTINAGFVNTNETAEVEDGAQISSLTMNSHGKHWMKRTHDELEIPSGSNKRTRTRDNRRKKNKINEDEQKCSSETSENDESNGSHQLINEDVKKKSNRGAATDPQSLYARKRRDRINERLRILQSLVPNGTKVDLSTMLEEAVNYVKFLQMQIKLLSSEETWMYAPLAYNGFHVGL